MGDDQELIKSKKPLKLGTWPRAIPCSVVVPDDFFFCPLYCVLVCFRRSAAGQYNVSMQPMPRLSCTLSLVYIFPPWPNKCQGKVH